MDELFSVTGISGPFLLRPQMHPVSNYTEHWTQYTNQAILHVQIQYAVQRCVWISQINSEGTETVRMLCQALHCKEAATVEGDSVMSELIFSFPWSVFCLPFIENKLNTLTWCHTFWCLYNTFSYMFMKMDRTKQPDCCTTIFKTFYTSIFYLCGGCGGAVVKVLCHKSESRWFHSRWYHWNFPLK
jgi:hypothetical protein